MLICFSFLDHDYITVSFVGFIKQLDVDQHQPSTDPQMLSWTDSRIPHPARNACLALYGRTLPPPSGGPSRSAFTLKLRPDKTIMMIVEERSVLLLGYLPQDLVGKSYLSFVHRDDISAVEEAFQAGENIDNYGFAEESLNFGIFSGNSLDFLSFF